MSFTFENQGTNTYLVYKIRDNDSLDTTGLGMLTNNKISGLVPAFFTQMDNSKYIRYNVTSKVSVKHFFDGYVNKKRLTGVFNSIVVGMLSAEDYMLDINSILLDLDYIFVDVSTCEASLICLPIIKNEEKHSEIGQFFKNIMFSTQFDQSENCDYVAKIINFLNSSPVFSLVEFKAILDEIINSNEKGPEKEVQQAQQPKLTTVVKNQASYSVNTEKAAAPAAAINSRPVSKQAPIAPQTPKAKAVPTKPVSKATAQGEKQMTWLKLMMNYSKENAALYKEQKAARKANKGQAAKMQPVNNSSFNVPGTAASNVEPAQAKVKPQATTQVKMPSAVPTQKNPTPKKPEHVVAQQASPPIRQGVSTSQPGPQNRPMSFGETTVLGGVIGETTVLNAGQQTQPVAPFLFRVKNNEKIMIDKPVFRIGKERSYVDYFISDNTAVSRSHANLITRDNSYYIMDTNSTNHTFINDVMIQSNVETELKHGDKIRLANEVFVFNLY